MLLTTPVPFTDAANLLRGKLPVTRAIFDAMLPELRAASVVITGVEDLRAIERVRNIAAGIPEGEDWDAARDRIIAELDPWLNDPDAAERRAELLLRSHAYAAYSTMNYRALEEQSDIFTWKKYQTAQDERVRGTHRALDGVIAPASSPFWRDHTPPWDFGCRCDVVGLTDDDVEELRQTGSQIRDEEGKPAIMIIEPGTPELEALEQGNLFRDQTMHFVARDPDHYIYDPAAPLITTAMLEDMKKRVGPKAWAAFQDWARNAEVPGVGPVWNWMTRKAPARKPAAGAASQAAKLAAAVAKHRLAKPAVAAAFPRSKSPAAVPINAALDAIEDVHGDGQLPPIAIKTIGEKQRRGVMGVFSRIARRDPATGRVSILPEYISLRMSGNTRELTAAHEIGHFLACFGLSPDGNDAVELLYKDPTTAIGKWWQVVTATPSYQAIYAGPWDTKHSDYLAGPDEVFARGYAQYIATRSRSAAAVTMRAQLAAVRNSRRKVTQWDEAEFAPVADAFDAIFKEKGWLRPR